MSATRKSLYAAMPATQRGQAVHLAADPKNERLLYCNGRSVYMRNLVNPALATEYTEHTCAATVARWSPSGYYIASGDVQGNVRIWDATQDEQILKLATRPISGRINDLSWDSESKRLIAVGDGKERYGHAFSFDTGNSVGEILGHSKVINACSIRPQRPFRAATCSDDMSVIFYHGPPYKFAKSMTDHTRFVQCVRFSGDGKLLASAGSDGKIFLYDGSTGDKISEVSENGHTGGVFSLSWNADSTQFMTSSADMTVKIWDVATKKAVNTITFADIVDDQQVGNLWAGSHMVSLALSGDLHYLDPRTPKPVKTVRGHQKAITAFAVNPAAKRMYTGSYDGRVYVWDTESGVATAVSGTGHTNQASGFALSKSGKIYSIGMDDMVRAVDVATAKFDNMAVPTSAMPKAIDAHGDISIVATVKELLVIKAGKVASTLPIVDIPLAVAISPSGEEMAVGGEDNKIHLYTLAGTVLTKKPLILEANRGQVSALAYSPDGTLLAAGDADRKIMVYNTSDGTVKLNQWVFHSARVTCIAWSPCGRYAVSGALDRNIHVWSVERPMKFVEVRGAHQEGVTNVGMVDEVTVVSTGQDACVKTWTVVHPRD